jgi:hypothetical protein
MSHTRLAYMIFLAFLLLTGSAHAQEPQARRAADPELQKKAIDLLRTVADQIGTLQSTENRARLGSNIAASLWKHDEQRARRLLDSVQIDINLGLQTVDEDERTNTEMRLVFFKLRIDTVGRIATLDAEAALAFLKATEPEMDLTKAPELAEMTRHLEIQLANQIAAENPELALKLGRNSVARGFSNELLKLLRLLARKDREKAQILYKEIVAKLVKTGLKQYSQATYFAQTLATSYKPPKVDEQTYRELINLFVETSSQHGCGTKTPQDGSSYFCQELARFFPKTGKANASSSAESTLLSEEAEGQEGRDLNEEIEDLSEYGSVDEMLAFANKKPPELQDDINLRAVLMAAEGGDIERAREIAIKHITNPDLRQEILTNLDEGRAWQSMTDQKQAEVQEILRTIPDVLGRVNFLLSLASHISFTDRKMVFKLLAQAGGIIETMKPGHEKTQAEISLAMMYCGEKDGRGFDKMQELMPQLNDLVAASAKLDGFESNTVTDGEWNMSSDGSIGTLLTLLSQGAGYFARCDFDRALEMARQFERSEIRLMAEIKLAQAILATPTKRQPLIFQSYSKRGFRR